MLGFHIDWIEHQLAHAVKDANGRAHIHTKHLSQRAEMVQQGARLFGSATAGGE